MLEPMHGPIRSYFIRLRHLEPGISAESITMGAFLISNYLYRYDVLSAFEAANCFRRPIFSGNNVILVDYAIIKAHANHAARRKLIGILRSHSLQPGQFKPGDLVPVFVRGGKQNRGKWLSPRQIMSTDSEACILSILGLAGRLISVAFEYTRVDHLSSDITLMLQDEIDQLDCEIIEILDASELSRKSGNSNEAISIYILSDGTGNSEPFDVINEHVLSDDDPDPSYAYPNS